MVATMIRVPRITGLPWQIFGLISMRSIMTILTKFNDNKILVVVWWGINRKPITDYRLLFFKMLLGPDGRARSD